MPGWIGWKARPLLRIRYGSEDDARLIPEGEDIRQQSCKFWPRAENYAFRLEEGGKQISSHKLEAAVTLAPW